MSEAQPEIKTEVTTDAVMEEIVVSTEMKNIIEALIFASDEPMSVKFIRSIMDDVNKDLPPSRHYVVNAEIIRKAVGDLNRGYGRMGSGFRIIEIGGGFTFATQEQFSSWVGKLAKERARRRLSPTAVETLAIIAYKQPIAKGEVEFIRGVNVDYIINALLEKDLIHITGRAGTPGRPLLYGTTQKFLEHFGLNELSDLPKPREISELINETELEVDRRLLAEQQELEFKQDLETKLEGNEGSKNRPQKTQKIKVPDEVSAENRKAEKQNGTKDQADVPVENKNDGRINIEEGVPSSESNLAIDEVTAEPKAVQQNGSTILENEPEIPETREQSHLESDEAVSPEHRSETSPVNDSTSSRSLVREEPAVTANEQDRPTTNVRVPSETDAPGRQAAELHGRENRVNDPENPAIDLEKHLTENGRTILTADAADHSDRSNANGDQEQNQPAGTATGWSKWKNKVKTFFQKLFA